MIFGPPYYLEKFKYIFCLFLICFLGFIFRIYRLESRSIWVDETFTLFEPTAHGQDIQKLLKSECSKEMRSSNYFPAHIYKSFLKYDAGKKLKDVAISLIKTDTHPPLYFFIMHFWIKYFGGSLFSIRFFSVLLGIVATITAFLFTSALFGKKAGLFAALFLALSPFAVFYSQEARHYSLILAIALLSSYFFIRFQNDNRNVLPLGFIITVTLGLYTHYFYIFILLAYVTYFIFFSGCSAEKRNKFCIAFLISLLLLLPWVFLVLLFGYNFELTEWLFGYPNNIKIIFSWLINNLSSFFFIAPDKNFPGLMVFNYLGIFCLPFLIKALLKPRKEFTFPGIMFFLSILCMAVIDLVEKGSILQHPRYYTFILISLIPIIGYMFSSNWAHKIYRPLIILIFTVLLINSFFVVEGYAWRDVSTPRPKNACLFINRESQGKKTALITGNGRANVMPLAFYLNKDILIVPVDSAVTFKSAFEQLRGRADEVFIVQFIFENIILDSLSSWLDEVGSPGFRLEEKREFKRDFVIVSKFI